MIKAFEQAPILLCMDTSAAQLSHPDDAKSDHANMLIEVAARGWRTAIAYPVLPGSNAVAILES